MLVQDAATLPDDGQWVLPGFDRSVPDRALKGLHSEFKFESKAIPPVRERAAVNEMVGTTRSRVSFFMNKFRALGFIHYNDRLEVHSSLLSVALHD